MEPRSTAQRKADVLKKLQDDVDLWVASASATGEAHLVPLSFYWDGARLIFATPENSPTARNLRRAGVARVALGPTRDVVIIDGSLEFIPVPEAAPELVETHAMACGFRPGLRSVYIRLTPIRVQAWREVDEIPGRDAMIDGSWLA